MPRRYILSFANGPQDRVDAMRRELLEILPHYEHHSIGHSDWLDLMRRFPPFTIAHTAALLGPGTDNNILRQALALAPTRMLAYNPSGDRFHLHPKQALASLRFLNGEAVHSIHLLPWQDRTLHYGPVHHYKGRAATPHTPTVAILSPYFPWPLSHGATVRIFNLIQQSAANFNIHLFAFTESAVMPDLGPLEGLCTAITLVRKPTFRRLPWSSLEPAEVLEYATPAMRKALSEARYNLLQTEFTHLAPYGGDILVEHDITMDLAAQEHHRNPTLSSAWNLFRWRRFEKMALRNFAHTVVMSDKDRAQIEAPNVHVLPNGVDLERYRPRPESPGRRLLFIGSFRHFPNALAYRFLAEELMPLLSQVELTVVAGPDPEIYYPFGKIPQPKNVLLHSFVADVRPLYEEANLVLIPTPISAGTNIKALEAMAMCRAILSTPSGVNGLNLEQGKSVWIANDAPSFAEAIDKLLANETLRHTIANTARHIVKVNFDWRSIASKQEDLWRKIST